MAISLATAVGWLVSPLIKIMIDKTRSYVSGRYSWSSDMIEDLTKLEDYLTQILLVVGVAERRKIVEPTQAMLLRRIKDVVYEVEDVMDEFDYLLLKENAEKKNLVRYLASSSLSVGKRLIGLDMFKPKLTEVIKKLERIKSSAKVFLEVMGTENTGAIRQAKLTKWRATSSVSHELVVGRKEERDRLIEILQELENEPDQDNMNFPRVISLVGDGGIGKTTLTQTIYNDQITTDFGLKMWVCVSENFEKTKLAEQILVAATDNKNIMLRNYSYDLVQLELKKALINKKFLLVLDDVWYDENIGKELYKDTWKDLFGILRNGVRGSIILVTTRMKLVAEMLGSSNLVPLTGLKADDSWSLFSKYAFGCEEPDDHRKLKIIGEKILQKLEGSALAIKVIGGQLNANFDVEEWDRILKNDLSKPNDIMAILRLSYEYLPEHLQCCFAYCSLFPKDWNLDLEKIIDMWIVHGFVHREETDDTSLGNIGRDYFNELVSRSFIQELKRDDKIFYVMHDLMNDLALHVSDGVCFRIEHEKFVFPCSVRHLSIMNNQLDKLQYIKELKRLRTLIVLDDSVVCSKAILEGNLLEEFTSMRVLDLSGSCLDGIPNTIDRLVHLRYLAMKRSSHPLPKSVYRLYHLQVLAILYHSCHFLGPLKFCKHVTNLTGLLHVDVAGAYSVILDCMPYLACLRADGIFDVKKNRGGKFIKCVNRVASIFHIEHESVNRLVELKDRNELRGKLCIKSLENVKNSDEAEEACLDHKRGITELELEYQQNKENIVITEKMDVLEALKPHRNIEKLVVKGPPGTKPPSWLETDWLNRVQTIHLSNCYYWISLPALGQLPFLSDLKVTKNDSINKIGAEFYGNGVFPSLVRLCFEELSQLQEWFDFDGRQLFPKLRQLLISRCTKLTKIPPLPVGLEYFSICTSQPYVDKDYKCFYLDFLHYVNDNSIPSKPLFGLKAKSFIFLDCLHFHHLNSFQVLDIDFESNIRMLKRLLQLIKSQKFLKELRLRSVSRDCVELILAEHKDEWSDVIPTSLQSLEMGNCYFTFDLISIWLEKLVVHNHEASQNTLKELTFINCEGLEILPNLDSFAALEKLHLGGCDALKTLTNVGYSVSLKILEITDCHEIKTLEGLHGLVSLTELKIKYCNQLLSLPRMDSFYALDRLEVCWCVNLKSLPKSGLPLSLTIMLLSYCNPMLHEQFAKRKGREWDKIAAILLNGHSSVHIEIGILSFHKDKLDTRRDLTSSFLSKPRSTEERTQDFCIRRIIRKKMWL